MPALHKSLKISDKIWRKPELVCNCGRKYKRFGWLIRHQWSCYGIYVSLTDYIFYRRSPLMSLLGQMDKTEKYNWIEES